MKKTLITIVSLLVGLASTNSKADDSSGPTIFDPIGYAASLVGQATAIPTITIGGITFSGWSSSQTSKKNKRKEELAAAQKEANEYLAQNNLSQVMAINEFPRLAGLVEDMKLIAETQQTRFSQADAIHAIALMETLD